METIKTANYQEYTKLPVKVIQTVEKLTPTLIMESPMGLKTVNIQQTNRKMFGATTQTDRYAGEILNEIYKIEQESKDFLLDKWVAENNKE